jgi:hypothetical protein
MPDKNSRPIAYLYGLKEWTKPEDAVAENHFDIIIKPCEFPTNFTKTDSEIIADAIAKTCKKLSDDKETLRATLKRIYNITNHGAKNPHGSFALVREIIEKAFNEIE